MTKIVVSIILERKMNVEENIINKIMDYHGDIYKMLPEGKYPESVKRCMKQRKKTLDAEGYFIGIILK